MYNPFKQLSPHEWLLWGMSVVMVTAANLLVKTPSLVTLAATLIGVTALIFVARGDVWGQALTVVFSVLYAITSYQLRYYGEMLTYLGMTAPIAALSVVSWLRHPYKQGRNEVKIHRLTVRQTVWMWMLAAAATAGFGALLVWLDTPNILFSIISITTSFLASFLMLYRHPYYALAYAANDVVLIVLWVLASVDDIAYLPMVLCFLMFLLNDLYGFISWKRRETRQKRGE